MLGWERIKDACIGVYSFVEALRTPLSQMTGTMFTLCGGWLYKDALGRAGFAPAALAITVATAKVAVHTWQKPNEKHGYHDEGSSVATAKLLQRLTPEIVKKWKDGGYMGDTQARTLITRSTQAVQTAEMSPDDRLLEEIEVIFRAIYAGVSF